MSQSDFPTVTRHHCDVYNNDVDVDKIIWTVRFLLVRKKKDAVKQKVFD